MVALFIGLFAGVLSGLFGIGGGIVIVPGLVNLLGMELKQATGTSMGAMLLPVGLLGAWQYHQRGLITPTVSLLVAGGLFAGAYFGARLAIVLPMRVVGRAFSVLMVLAAVQLWVKSGRIGETVVSQQPMETEQSSAASTRVE